MPRLHYEEAIATILSRCAHGRRVVSRPLRDATGLVLAEDVRADLDMPAFNRAAMDGFAFRHADCSEAQQLRVVGDIAAGDPVTVRLGPGECVRIMTGAAVPADADTVIPVEETSAEEQTVRFHSVPPKGAHIAPRGQDMRAGQVALAEGRLLSPQEIAILASVGNRAAPVYAGPAIAFAATGEELIEPGEPLRPGCIRNSNAYALWSQILLAKAEPHYLGILRDRVEDLREKLATGLGCDMLVVSGGISMGAYDLVPAVLEELGVEILFRKLYVRPGQPTLFGIRPRADGQALVFGLPGNPVSTLLAFDQYVAPAIRVFRGHPRPLTPLYQGELTQPAKRRPGVLTLVPCIAEWRDDRFALTPVRMHGSADIYSTSGVNAVALIEAGDAVAHAGASVHFRMLYEP